MRKLIYLFCCLSLIVSCSSESEEPVSDDVSLNSEGFNNNPKSNLKDNFEIKGKIEGAVNQPLTLEALSNQGTITLAQTSVKEDGTFFMKGNVVGVGIYQLKLGFADGKVIPLTLEPNDKVFLKAKYENFELLPVWSGADWAEPLNLYMSKFNEFALKQVELSKNTKMSQDDQIAAFLKLRKPLDDFARESMLKDLDNPANIILSTSLTPSMGFDKWDPSFLDVLKKVAKAYSEKYKESPIALSMQKQAMEIEAGLKEYKLTSSGNKIAPEISLKNPQGKEIKLSSLKGKVVLIDFWASWCGPCRKENPNVVRLYNKYKSKNFTVYSVSLDKDADAWKRAIEADGLIWPNHVSDLLQWQTPLTQTYGFNSIPYTVLVGKDGKIIATNLRGSSLEQKLEEVL